MGASGSSSALLDTQSFDRLDIDNDGMLSREEAQADPALSGAYEQLDMNNRGSISREDFERYRASQPDRSSANSPGSDSASGMPGGSTSNVK